MKPSVPDLDVEQDLESAWKDRQRYWGRKLRRLRLAAEPVEEQLDRYRRATWILTALLALLALFFVGLFAAFERPDIGGVLALVLLAPIVSLAWIDYGLLARRAARYSRELHAHRKRTNAPERT